MGEQILIFDASGQSHPWTPEFHVLSSTLCSQILSDLFRLIRSFNRTLTPSKNFTSSWSPVMSAINLVTFPTRMHRTSAFSLMRSIRSSQLERFNRFCETTTSPSPIFPQTRWFQPIGLTSTKLGSSFSQISRHLSNSKASG